MGYLSKLQVIERANRTRHFYLICPAPLAEALQLKRARKSFRELIGQRDLARFYGEIGATDGVAGRPARDPRLMLSLWIYAYMEGIPSAREIARQCESNAGFQWLTGATTVSAHALSCQRRCKNPHSAG